MKKDNHRWQCHNQRKYFSLFVILLDGMLDKEAQVVLDTCIKLMAPKIEQPIFNIKGWVNDQISIAVARLYSQILYGAWFPSTLRTRYPD